MEMRSEAKHIITWWAYTCCCILIFILITPLHSIAQHNVKNYIVRNGKMIIELSKKLPEDELNTFIAQFDLKDLALKKFINKGYADSIIIAGWKVEKDTKDICIITKSLFPMYDINDLAQKILFTGEHSVAAQFPSVSNSVVYGYNRFKNKFAFAINNGAVTFYLRNNLKANKVMLAGSFNAWKPEALSMTKTDSGWIAVVRLSPGKYWYKFIIDGDWTIDTDNRLSENDGEGNTNSVFYYANTTFTLNAYANAKRVYVSGSFNNWAEKELAMTKTPVGWQLPLYLADGTHTYRFIVDGNWMTDPANPQRFPNEFNDYNSVITIGKPHVFKLDGYTAARKVILTGSFNAWKDYELPMKKTATGWELPYVLASGNYEYKFMVDGKSIADPANPNYINSKNPSSYLILDPNYTFHLKGFAKSKTIFLAGDFNGWNPSLLPMKRDGDGWSFTVHLSPGKHLYKYIVDGNWIIDPDNKIWEQNDENTGNSVLWIDKK